MCPLEQRVEKELLPKVYILAVSASLSVVVKDQGFVTQQGFS